MISIKQLHIATFLLMAIGAINWGLVGLFGLNLVSTLFGSMPSLESLVYVLIGASGVYILATHMNDCKICSARGKR